jgi:hypothetical protein
MRSKRCAWRSRGSTSDAKRSNLSASEVNRRSRGRTSEVERSDLGGQEVILEVNRRSGGLTSEVRRSDLGGQEVLEVKPRRLGFDLQRSKRSDLRRSPLADPSGQKTDPDLLGSDPKGGSVREEVRVLGSRGSGNDLQARRGQGS